MSKISNSKILRLIWSTILGKISFLVGGIAACIVILKLNNYILGTIIAGGIGGLVLGLFHWKQKMIGKMAVASLISVPVGLLGSFILVEGLVGGLGLLFPASAAYFETSEIANLVAIILMGVAFGIIFGAVVYGRKSLRLFAVTCGIASIPCGLLIAAMNSGYYIKVFLGNLFQVFGNIDLNFLVIIIGFGVGAGLSLELYNKKE